MSIPNQCHATFAVGCPSAGGQRTSVVRDRCFAGVASPAHECAVPNRSRCFEAVQFQRCLGRPSAGGRLSVRGSHPGPSKQFNHPSAWLRSMPSRGIVANRQALSLAPKSAASGLPNPPLKRTCFQQARLVATLGRTTENSLSSLWQIQRLPNLVGLGTELSNRLS